MPSIMASFVGCSSLTITADEWALPSSSTVETMATTAPRRMVLAANSACLPFSMYQPATAKATNAPMTSKASTVCP